MKKIGFGTRPSEVKGRNKRIDFGETSRDDRPESSDQRIYTPRRQPRTKSSSLSFGKILLLAVSSMLIGILLGGFLLFDFSLSVAIDSMQFITGGREIEIKNDGQLSVKYADGLKFKALDYKGLYRFFPPGDVKVEIKDIPDTTNRFFDDVVALLRPEERLSYDIVFYQGATDLGKIVLNLEMDSQAWLQRAEALQNKQQQIECYKKAVALDPDSEEAHAALGKLYEADQKYKSAIAEYEAVIRLKPSLVSAMQALIVLYKKTGMDDKTLEMYEKLAKADPGRADDYMSRAGTIAEKQGSDEKAIGMYLKLLEKSRTNIDARQKIIKLYEKNKKWDKVIEHAKVLISLDPKNPDLYLYLSDIYYKKNDINGALAAVEKAQKLRPNDSSVFLQLAVLSEKAKKDDQAIEFYEKAIKSNVKKNPVVYNNLGMLLEKKGDKKEAIQNYEIAALLEPKNSTFSKNLADAYEKEQQWKKAAEVYEKLAVLDKNKTRDATEAAAVLWYKAGNKEKSLGAYKNLAKAEPKKILWHQKLAYIYEDLHKVEDAMGEYKKILELDPANTEAKQKRVELAKRRLKAKGAP